MDNQETPERIKIRLNRKEFVFFQNHLVQGLLKTQDGMFLYATKSYLKSILDDLSNRLINEGFDENDEPNTLGIEIEHNIDIISRAFYS